MSNQNCFLFLSLFNPETNESEIYFSSQLIQNWKKFLIDFRKVDNWKLVDCIGNDKTWMNQCNFDKD